MYYDFVKPINMITYSMKQQIKNPIINLLISFSYKRAKKSILNQLSSFEHGDS